MVDGATEHGARRGRQPLPTADRGETISCYLPRWAVERLGERADGARLSRNKLVREIVIAYLAGGQVEDGAGAPGTRGGR